VLKLGYFGNYIRNIWKIIKCDAGEDQLDRSCGKWLQRAKEEKNILHTTNCLLKHTVEGNIEGRIEVMERRRRRHKQLPKDLQENRGYWKLKEQTLACTVWRTCFGRGDGSLLTQTTK
jgi:hypothetical protein